MKRFARYKALQVLWTRARQLLAYLHGPRHQEARLRAQRWQQIQLAERQIADGIVRGIGDPDSVARPHGTEQRDVQQRAWIAQREAQQQWMERQHWQAEALRHRQGRR